MSQDTDDRYERKHEAATAADLIGDIALPLLGHSPEWWEKREREIAAEKAKADALDERTRLTNRAGELRDNGFPEMAVSVALGSNGGGDGGDGKGNGSDLLDTTAMRQARVFVHLPKKVLVLAGGVGVGKTTAATWVAMMGQDPRPGFIRIAELERRGRYDRSLDEWLKDKTSLVIDDVGAEVLDGKGVFRALLDEVIDMFYGNRRTLVMTTNLRPCRSDAGKPRDPDEIDQFAERYGERVWSRIGQLGVWGDCGTRDLRREQP